MAILAAFDIFILKSLSQYPSKRMETGDHCSIKGKSSICSPALLHDKKEDSAMITSRCINSRDALQYHASSKTTTAKNSCLSARHGKLIIIIVTTLSHNVT
jgi:hypothetical protein